MGKEIIYFILFPGFLFSALAGGVISWLDRKITARVQFRQGPPFLQPFYDFIKLLAKETIVPTKGSIATFLTAPVLAVFGATVSAVILLLPAFGMGEGFTGDLIVLVYLLNIPSLTYMLGAMASGNPLAAVGASREMKLILSYEVPFLLTIVAVIINSGMSIKIADVLSAQASGGAFIGSLSGILGFIAALLCVQAKLALVPFDVTEAEGEICDGVTIEYSGLPYGLIILTKYIMFLVLPVLLGTLFMNGMGFSGLNILWTILKLILIVLLISLIRNTNPRVKIKQAMKFFWVWVNLIALLSVVFALIGI